MELKYQLLLSVGNMYYFGLQDDMLNVDSFVCR